MARKSMMFIGSFMNFDLAGQTVSLTTNSTVKNMMTVWSMMLMMSTMTGNSMLPSESSCSSSAVDMMNVSVDTMTADSETRAAPKKITSR